MQADEALHRAYDDLEQRVQQRTAELEARREELEARYYAERVDSLVRAQIALENMKSIDAELQRARERARDLVVRSPSEGIFALPSAEDLPGRFLRQGELVGYVTEDGSRIVRVVVSQDDVDLVRSRTERVEVKVAGRLYDSFEATIRREVPAASNRVANLALSSVGG